ncbi:MAG: trypsin-like peptidase domain-containing protein [Gemmatimonadota bacterium]
MSVRSLNWLKFGGLVGLAFALGLLFAGLLDLPKNSVAQNAQTRPAAVRTTEGQAAAKMIPAAVQPLASLSDAFASVAEQVRPSVVYVQSQRTERVSQNRQQVPPGFQEFFGTPRGRSGPQIERGSGSGFIVSADGYILTNNHVVDGADVVHVRLLDRHEFSAKVIGADASTDVAIIKIDPRGLKLTPASLGSSAATRIGEWVLAFGNPLNEQLTFTVTSGIVSAKGRGQLQLPNKVGGTQIQDFLQTDAAINPGNSGGPLVNVKGEVIGINSAIASPTGFNAGYAFAIPIDLAKVVMDQLISHGKVERSALGVGVAEATPADAKYVGLDEIRGVRIQTFSMPKSPAELAGLEQGDLIIGIDGQRVDYVAQLQQIVGFRKPGETVKVEVARKGGVRRTYTVRLVAQVEQKVVASDSDQPDDDSGANQPVRPRPTSLNRLGISVVPVTPAVAQQLELPANTRGLVIQEVDPYGPAEGILAGAAAGSPDVIVAVEGKPVRSQEDLRTAIREAGAGGVVSLTLFNQQANNGRGGTRIERVELSDKDK